MWQQVMHPNRLSKSLWLKLFLRLQLLMLHLLLWHLRQHLLLLQLLLLQHRHRRLLCWLQQILSRGQPLLRVWLESRLVSDAGLHSAVLHMRLLQRQLILLWSKLMSLLLL